ncbi:hypothetical protein [Curtobacterium sp. MCBA15_008]|uniref:hypothetical protein n=1 Tax=Curtobacterium sp. MCBA15_008 TaxID=1898736 RepID=UPI0008DCF959|nr:hypothetical protein [Curtobacterium sp. MCBA15_008]OII04312.1 hypothetical protein BIU96_07890 [Curtobacterium sp. MCBA15_008]
MTSARQQVVDAIKPVLPQSWRLVPYLTSLDAISQTTVMLHATGVERFPSAPAKTYLITFEATVIDPSKDPARVWDALDDEVLEAIAALDSIDSLDWTGAEPVAISNLFGWTITFTVPYEHED